MTNEADKLLPCPHCGGKAAYVPRAVNLALQKDPSDPKFGVSVICGTCSAETGNFIDEAAASLRWNRRACAAAPAEPPATPLREVLEQIKQAIKDYHYALDTRQHGGVAQDKAYRAIEDAMGLPWRQGEEKARREKT